jgi:hypothetical protein
MAGDNPLGPSEQPPCGCTIMQAPDCQDGEATNLIRYGLFVLSFAFLQAAAAQDHSNRIFDPFTGRYHCGGRWTEFQIKMTPVTGPLGMDEPGGVVSTFSATGLDTAGVTGTIEFSVAITYK